MRLADWEKREKRGERWPIPRWRRSQDWRNGKSTISDPAVSKNPNLSRSESGTGNTTRSLSVFFGCIYACRWILSWWLMFWRWVCRHLSIEKNRYLYIRLFPEPSRVSKDQPPLARFVLRVSNTGANRRPYISPSMHRFVLFLPLVIRICAFWVFFFFFSLDKF